MQRLERIRTLVRTGRRLLAASSATACEQRQHRVIVREICQVEALHHLLRRVQALLQATERVVHELTNGGIVELRVVLGTQLGQRERGGVNANAVSLLQAVGFAEGELHWR